MSTLNTTGKVLYKSKMRIGRGIGSGKGKTSGRGVKGQKSRSGVAIKAFEGGQMPLYRRLPKRGFNAIKRYQSIIAIMNLDKIQSFINEKTINVSDVINIDLLKKLKLINKNSEKLKILGSGDIKDKVNIEADLISKSAVVKLEKAGGTIQLKK
jgi:large subunit ribosomal protein L15